MKKTLMVLTAASAVPTMGAPASPSKPTNTRSSYPAASNNASPSPGRCA